MAAFIEVEQWFASALAQRLALETVGNLAALEGQDGEEEDGVTFSLRQDAAAEFMDQSGMVKQVVCVFVHSCGFSQCSLAFPPCDLLLVCCPFIFFPFLFALS